MFRIGSLLFKQKRNIAFLVLSVYFLLFFFSWTYKLGILPGLHGDEAWSGIKADFFAKHSFDQLSGMNQYSGVLQAGLAQFTFSLFTTNVFSLRFGSVIFNISGLLIICCTLIRHKYYRMAIAFLVIMSQSALYLTCPRVAWEVNTFSLFFISLLFTAVVNFYRSNSFKKRWALTILLVNSLGAYNHIIFSAIPVSMFIGLCLWALYYKNFSHKRLIILIGVSICNISLLFFIMNFFPSQLLALVYLLPFIFCGIFLVEYWLIVRLSNISCKPSYTPEYFQFSIKVLLLTSILLFSIFHGKAFFEVLSGYKIFLQNYSYECQSFLKVLLMICASVFIYFLMKFLWQDFQNSTSSIFVFFIVSYLGVLSIYTVRTSFRYYLCIYVIVAVYMAFKLSNNAKSSKPLILSLFLSFSALIIFQVRVFSKTQPLVKAIQFTIGNGQVETSAHFLPKEPLIKFLRDNDVGYISCPNENPLFVILPAQFYKINNPWKESLDKQAVVDYDYTHYKNGYLFFLER
jgi:hypothetical protein